MSATFTSGSTTAATGDIQSGWSVSEDATPVNPLDTSAGTGLVSFTLGQGKDSEFLIDSTGTFTHDLLGSISGFVQAADSNGAEAGTDTTLPVDMTTPLSGLAVERTAAPMAPGAPLGTQILPNATVNYRGIAMGGAGNYRTYVSGETANRITVLSASGATDLTFGATEAAGGAGTNGTFAAAGDIATDGSESVYALDFAGTANHQRIQKFDRDGVYITKWGTTGTGNGQFSATNANLASIDTDYTASPEVYVSDPGNSRIQVFTSTGTYSRQWATPAQPLAIRYAFGYSLVYVLCANGNIYSYDTSGGSQSVLATGVSTNAGLFYHDAGFGYTGFAKGRPVISYRDVVGGFIADIPANMGPYRYTIGSRPNREMKFLAVDAGTMTGSVVSYMGSYLPLISTVINYYLALVFAQGSYVLNVASGADFTVTGIPSWTGRVWSYIRDLLSTYSLQISTGAGNTIYIRQIGQNSISLAEVAAGSLQLALDATGSSRTVRVRNYNYLLTGGTYRNAYRPNSSYSLNVGQIDIIYATVDHSLTYVGSPLVQITTPGSIDSANSYIVTDANNLIVQVADWAASGGMIEASLVEGTYNQIQIVLTGPKGTIPGYTAPFSIGGKYQATATDVVGMTVGGIGVISNPVDIDILTGANPDRVTDIQGGAVDNVFIGTTSQAYDRALWATTEESGPDMVLTGAIPTWKIGAFGLSAGSLVTHKENQYRISDLKIGDISTSFTARRYMPVGQYDALWSGKTVGQYDTFWSGKRTQDTSIKSLRVG